MKHYSESNLKGLRARELKAILSDRGVSFDKCVEKVDFVALVLETNPSEDESTGKGNGEEKGLDTMETGMQIVINTLLGRTIATLEVDSSHSIASVKQRIEAIEGVDSSMQLLLLVNQRLHDDRTFASYDIQDKATLTMLIEPSKLELKTFFYTDERGYLVAERKYVERPLDIERMGPGQPRGGTQDQEEQRQQDQRNFAEEVKQHTLSLAIAREAGEEASAMDCYLPLGHAFFGLDEAKLAMVCYEKLLAFKEKEGDQKLVSRLHGCLGTCHTRLKQFDNALESVNKSLAVALEIGDKQEESIARFYLSCLQEQCTTPPQ